MIVAVDTEGMVLSKRVSAFLVLFGVWSWVIWPTFLHNIWRDSRSWQHGPTGFFGVHAALTAVSLILGSIIGWLGVRGWRAAAHPAARYATDQQLTEQPVERLAEQQLADQQPAEQRVRHSGGGRRA